MTQVPLVCYTRDNFSNTIIKQSFIPTDIYFEFCVTGQTNERNYKFCIVKKQIKYFDVLLEHEWKVPVLQELLSTRMNNLYVEGFDDYITTEKINMLCNE